MIFVKRIIAYLVAIAAALAAFAIMLISAKRAGKLEAETQFAKDDADRRIEVAKAAAKTEIEAAKGAANEQNEANKLEPGAAADRLRNEWSRD